VEHSGFGLLAQGDVMANRLIVEGGRGIILDGTLRPHHPPAAAIRKFEFTFKRVRFASNFRAIIEKTEHLTDEFVALAAIRRSIGTVHKGKCAIEPIAAYQST